MYVIFLLLCEIGFVIDPQFVVDKQPTVACQCVDCKCIDCQCLAKPKPVARMEQRYYYLKKVCNGRTCRYEKVYYPKGWKPK